MTLLQDMIIQGAERFPDREAVADPKNSRSYAQLAEASRRIAIWLRRTGVRPGDRVVLMLPNGVDFIAAHFGVLMAGGISVPCEANASAATIAAIRDSCAPRASLDAVTIIEALATRDGTLPDAERTTDDLATLMYTTGSTGRPKGVMLTHGNTLAAIQNIIGFVGYTAQDREVVILPLSHSFGLGHVYCNLSCGGAVYTEPGLTRVGRVLRKVADWGATGFPGTPLGYAMLMDRYGEIFQERCRNLRFIVVNSAPLPPSEAARLRAMLPDVNLMVYYGLTEASRSTFISLSQCGLAYYGSVGQAMPGIDLRLSDENEVLIAGPTVAQGYWNDPEQTAAAFHDGYLHSGDQGRIDEDGFLHVTGRFKDLINVGGYKVYPAEIEKVLLEHDAVEDACAFGTDRVEAAIVTRRDVSEIELSRFCYQRLEGFKVPSRIYPVAFIQRSETGKIIRHAVAAQCRGT
ncbi:MAG: AMP-binding protein [Alphaproteobacteria bacterium]|nr:AMP-binding protein [Alphaproteobacteria bacterium]